MARGTGRRRAEDAATLARDSTSSGSVPAFAAIARASSRTRAPSRASAAETVNATRRNRRRFVPTPSSLVRAEPSHAREAPLAEASAGGLGDGSARSPPLRAPNAASSSAASSASRARRFAAGPSSDSTTIVSTGVSSLLRFTRTTTGRFTVSMGSSRGARKPDPRVEGARAAPVVVVARSSARDADFSRRDK